MAATRAKYREPIRQSERVTQSTGLYFSATGLANGYRVERKISRVNEKNSPEQQLVDAIVSMWEMLTL